MEAEIKATARRLMAEHGTAGVSLRLIAREMDLSAPSLYHYFPSFEALITALLVDAFNALADTLDEASTAPGRAYERAIAVATSARAWALRNPIDFQLIYGNPIPGYSAPREVTVPAVVRSYVSLATTLQQAWAGVQPKAAIPPTVASHLSAMREAQHYDVSLELLYVTLVLWTRMYGCIMLEILHHLGPSAGDSEAFFQAEVVQTLAFFGLTNSPDDIT